MIDIPPRPASLLRSTFLLAWLACASAPAWGQEAPATAQESTPVPTDVIPEELPFETRVKDPVFSALVGLVSSNSYGTLSREQLARNLERRNLKSKLPYQEVQSVTRARGTDDRSATVTVSFDGDLKLPVPYSLLGYHPGSFLASQDCVFREWIIGDLTLDHPEKVKGEWTHRPIHLKRVHLYGLDRGKISIDFDGWLDTMLGGTLDDTDVVGLILFEYEGVWTGMATGYSKKGSGRSGAFNFEEDEIMFPGPDEMKTIGRTLRKKIESWLPDWPVWSERLGSGDPGGAR